MLVREVSRSQLQHLDLEVSIADASVGVSPALAKIPIPLSPSSAHPPHIHGAWPSAVFQRISKLSDNSSIALSKLKANYRTAGADAFTMQRLRHLVPRSIAPTVELELVPIVLRYHPAFRGPVAHALKQLPLPASMPFKMVPSWTNALPSLQTHIARHNEPATITG